MKYISILFLLAWGSLQAQSGLSVRGLVVDGDNMSPLAFCNIRIVRTHQGTITNAEGVFILHKLSSKDSIEISYLGYQNQRIAVSRIQKNQRIELEKKHTILREVAIVADDDYLYETTSKCRAHLKKNRLTLKSKVYYGVESFSKQKPIELLECYYNAHLDGEETRELAFKNGRTALATADGNYFNTFNSAKAITKVSLTVDNGYFPSLPLQFSKRQIKKRFKLSLVEDREDLYCISFVPRRDHDKAFSGKLWIRKGSYELIKISLKAERASVHPFLPIHQTDKVSNVSLDIVQHFTKHGEASVPDYTSFAYRFNYLSVRDSNLNIKKEYQKIVERDIASNGIIEYYDYNHPFLLPYFSYPSNLYYGDYYKMSFIPYHQQFWEHHKQMLLTDQQVRNLNYIAKDGELLNYKPLHSSETGRKSKYRFDFRYAFWSPNERVYLKEDMEQYREYDAKVINQKIKSDLYSFKVQIFMDVSRIQDSLHCRTYTVFDGYESFYHLPHDIHTYGMLNIYFDLYEIERRKLDSSLRQKAYSLQEIDSIYQAAKLQMEEQGLRYLKEIELGENRRKLKKWNAYVKEQLGIDNLALVEETLKQKEKQALRQ